MSTTLPHDHAARTPDAIPAWVEFGFSATEQDALLVARRLEATEDQQALITYVDDGSVTWTGSREELERWQDAILERAQCADPFAAWTVDHSVAAFRGLVDRTGHTDPPAEPMPAVERRAVRRALAGSGRASVLAALATDEVDTWLAAPIGRLGWLSRYLHELWLGRPDLHGLFPRVGDNDRSTSGYLHWVRAHGAEQLGIPERFVPSAEEAAQTLRHPTPDLRGARVVGHVTDVIGIGEAARGVERALEHAGLEHHRLTDEHAGRVDVNLVCVNPPELALLATDLGPEFFAHRHTVGVWFWESTSAPPGLEAALAVVDEIWVASEYVRGVLEPHVAGRAPIHVMPLAVRVPAAPTHPRSHFALPDDAFLYGFAFDFNSTLERKNAVGLVEAYRRAHPTTSGDAALVLKTINAEQNVADHERLLLAAQDRPDIHLLDADLSVAERDSLIGVLDCYVSLHRSEGFGLTIAEALLAGVPTIATGYSANVEFAPGDGCHLVDYELTTVPEGLGPYPAGGQWAEPDLDHAARLMRHVREHPDEARAMAARGGERIRTTCSLDAAAAFLRERLEQIWKEHPLPDPATIDEHERQADPIAAVEHYVEHGPSGGWLAGTSGIRRQLRRLLLRTTRPYADRQRQLEVDVARSLRHLQQQVDDLAARPRDSPRA
jgi:hypothetical protein